MDLELESGRVFRGVTSTDILSHIKGDGFAILLSDSESYIQYCKRNTPPYGYELEERDGSKAMHFRATDEPIDLDRVVSAFLRYLDGDTTWRAGFRWGRVEFP